MAPDDSAHASAPGGDLTPGPDAEAAGLPPASMSLATRIGELAGTLPEQDRRLLAAVLLRAMDPVSARRWQPTEGLGPDELAVLSRLEHIKPDTEPDPEG